MKKSFAFFFGIIASTFYLQEGVAEKPSPNLEKKEDLPTVIQKYQRGKGILYYSLFFKQIPVYEITYWREEKRQGVALTFLRDVQAKHLKMGQDRGLPKNLPLDYFKHQVVRISSLRDDVAAELELFKTGIIDGVEKQHLLLIREGTTITWMKSLDGKTYELIKSYELPLLAPYIFSPWMGKESVDPKLKEELCQKDCP
jgi:hypothetical protein